MEIKGSNIKKGDKIGRGGFADVYRLESFSKNYINATKMYIEHTYMVILIVYTVKELRMNVQVQKQNNLKRKLFNFKSLKNNNLNFMLSNI